MKGLSNNTKTIATIFLFVCLAANSQVFQNSIDSSKGSATLAQSIYIESSRKLPIAPKNCKEAPDNDQITAINATINENDLIDKEDLSDEDDRDNSVHAARQRAKNSKKSKKEKVVEFRVNFKKYICNQGSDKETTELQYKLDKMKSSEGKLDCTGDCDLSGVINFNQEDSLEDIVQAILKDGASDEINIRHLLKIEDKKNKLKADMCEGEFNKEDGANVYTEYSNSDEDTKYQRECLVSKIISKKRRDNGKSLELFSTLEEILSDLAKSENKKDRDEAIKLINSLLKSSEKSKKKLAPTIIASLKNIKNYAKGSLVADNLDDYYDSEIKRIKSQACSVTPSAGCLSNDKVQTRVNELKAKRNSVLNSEKQLAAKNGWYKTEEDGGSKSYEEWSSNLSKYFDETIKKITGVYTGVETIANSGNSTTDSNYNNRFNFITSKNNDGSIQSGSSSSIFKNGDVGVIPSALK